MLYERTAARAADMYVYIYYIVVVVVVIVILVVGLVFYIDNAGFNGGVFLVSRNVFIYF